MNDDDLDVARAAVVREHMDSEDRHELDPTIATFSHSRYEPVATGEVFDGERSGAAAVDASDPHGFARSSAASIRPPNSH